jgi:hypothetical protein
MNRRLETPEELASGMDDRTPADALLSGCRRGVVVRRNRVCVRQRTVLADWFGWQVAQCTCRLPSPFALRVHRSLSVAGPCRWKHRPATGTNSCIETRTETHR